MNDLKGLTINLDDHQFLKFTDDEFEVFEIEDFELRRKTQSDYIYICYVYGQWYITFAQEDDLTVDTIMYHDDIKIEREHYTSKIVKII